MTRGRRAFTLLELLLATALAAMLMALILTFSTRIRSAQASLEREDPVRGVGAQLENLLQSDLALAEEVKIVGNAVTIVGYSRLDRDSQDLRHGPTRVRYQLISAGSHGYLVRQQSELDSHTNRESQVEVLLAGVRQFGLEAALSDTPESQAAGGKPTKFWLSLAWEEESSMPLHKLLRVD